MQLARVGHHDLVTHAHQQIVHPVRVSARLDHDPMPLQRLELAYQTGCARGDAAFLHDLTGSIQDTDTAVLVTQVHADRRNFCAGAILLHGHPPSGLALRVRQCGYITTAPSGGWPSHSISADASHESGDPRLLGSPCIGAKLVAARGVRTSRRQCAA